MMNRPIKLIAVVAATLICLSCGGRAFEGFPLASESSAYAWPAPPETARVAHVANITSHEDLYKIGGGVAGIFRFFAGPPDSRLSRPYAVAMHPDGGLLVTDPGRAVVHYYNWADRRYVAIGDGALPSPVGVAVLPGGDILIEDSKLSTIERFRTDGHSVGTFAPNAIFGRPAGIAVAPSGEVFVADATDHVIRVFDSNGNALRVIGERGAAPGQFNFPTHLAIDDSGNLLVTDSMNFRVQRLSSDGTPIATYGELGNVPGKFSKPKGAVALGNGSVAVVEGLYDALQIFNADGQLLLSIGGPGSEPGQFWLPAGIAVDRAQGLIFVADGYNSRIQVFRLLNPAGEATE